MDSNLLLSDAEPQSATGAQNMHRSGSQRRPELFIDTSNPFASLQSAGLHLQKDTTKFGEAAVVEHGASELHSDRNGHFERASADTATPPPPRVSDERATATPATRPPAAITASARTAATLPPDTRARYDSETLSSHSRTNSMRYTANAPYRQKGDAGTGLSTNSLSLPPAASETLVFSGGGDRSLNNTNTFISLPADGGYESDTRANSKPKLDGPPEGEAVDGGAIETRQTNRESRALLPLPPPTPRDPLVLRTAASSSFRRLDGHAKAVSRQTMHTMTELLPLLLNQQVVRNDVDKVRYLFI